MTSNVELTRRRQQAVPRGVANATGIYPDRASNAEIWDVEGRRFVDFAGGIAVLNTGHRHPQVLAAVNAQLERYTHTAFQVLPYEPYVALAERLNDLAPIDGPAKTILLTTGAEAVENAVKIARAATGRSAVIAFTGGFHGRSFMTMALTGKVKPYKGQFGPMAAEVYHLPFPMAAHGVTVEDSLRALERLSAADVSPERVAAVIVEPVQGEGGFYSVPPELMRALRAFCDAHGVLLIADEVQTGFGRTGRMFAMEHFDVRADLITVAKSLGGGFPIAGVIGRADVMDTVEPGGLGGTYAGSPIACAAALAVLDVIEREGLLPRAQVIGGRIKARLQGLQGRNDIHPISDVRGYGAMIAFELVAGWDGQGPAPEAARAVTSKALDLGLVLLSCGVHGNVIRIMVPLTVSDGVLEEGLDRLQAALTVSQ